MHSELLKVLCGCRTIHNVTALSCSVYLTVAPRHSLMIKFCFYVATARNRVDGLSTVRRKIYLTSETTY